MLTEQVFQLFIIHQSHPDGSSPEVETQIVSAVEQALESTKFVIQVVLGPLPITEHLLRPRKTLPFAVPKQNYLKFGPLDIPFDDISKEYALVAIEHDAGFCRIDGLNSFQDVIEKLGSGEGLLNCYQLADSFMRNLAFKMEKLDKFGA